MQYFLDKLDNPIEEVLTKRFNKVTIYGFFFKKKITSKCSLKSITEAELKKKSAKFRANYEKHPFHLVKPSYLPILMSWMVFLLVYSFVLYMHQKTHIGDVLQNLYFLVGGMGFWFSHITIEATYQGHHTRRVQEGLALGMKLFILSEVMFFVSFFWAYFHSCLNPAIQIGGIWPPAGIEIVCPIGSPLLNTCILLTSGMAITSAHKAIACGRHYSLIRGLVFAAVLGIWFTVEQGVEYANFSFTITDSVYGSLFYMLTGFHGFHVIVGTCFILATAYRAHNKHFTIGQHLGLIFCIWYWHFVDVVWIFLFIIVYWYGVPQHSA